LVVCGSSPHCLYTDFDSKILEGPNASFLREKHINLRGAPPGRQIQNGLVEHAWETMSNMARTTLLTCKCQ
jgi:hypothetical protein